MTSIPPSPGAAPAATAITFINDSEFDAQFVRTLAAAARGGADLGEALAVAGRIVPGDFASWHHEWSTIADQVRAEADRLLAEQDHVGARRAYLRASEYYRQAFFFLRTDLDDPCLLAAYDAHVATFQSATPLLRHPTQPMAISRGSVRAQGYLLTPDSTGIQRPTVILPAGYDSTAEAGYSFGAVTALDHGMNCLTFEGPGQGGILYRDRVPLRPDFEAVLTPVVDWLVDQPGVDPDALVLLGRSFAGYLAPRAATKGHRIAALICDPAQYDFAATVRRRMGEQVWTRLMDHDPTLDADLAQLMADPMERNGFASRMVTHGTTSLSDYFRSLAQFSLVGLADKITCPTLAVSGEGDFANTGQLHVFAQALTSATVTTHEFTRAEGAGGHCEGLGQDRFDQTAYHWLRGILNQGARRPQKHTATTAPSHHTDQEHRHVR